MPSVNKSIDIAAAPDAVWAKLIDFSSHGEWNAIHKGYPDGPPAALAPDTKFRESVSMMGMPAEIAWSITSVEPDTRLELSGDGPMGVKLRRAFAIEGAGGGTRVTLENEFEGAALGPMIDAVTQQAGTALEDSLEKLKQALA